MLIVALMSLVGTTTHPMLTFALVSGVGLAVAGMALQFSGTTASPLDASLGTFGAYVDQDLCGTEVKSANGAIASTHGTVIITKGSAAALTLAAPVAGAPAAGGNDGQLLTIVSTTAFAHTVTTPASTILDGTATAKDTYTFAAHAGGSITLLAYNGNWILVGSVAGALTEV
jgi:hypothetical protein